MFGYFVYIWLLTKGEAQKLRSDSCKVLILIDDKIMPTTEKWFCAVTLLRSISGLNVIYNQRKSLKIIKLNINMTFHGF